MAALKKPLLIEQYATFRWSFIWQTKAGKAIDLTGWSAKMDIKNAKGDTVALFELSTANGRILFGPKGLVTLFITKEDTGTIDFEKAVYDLVFLAPNGDAKRMFEGIVSVSPGCTPP